MHEFYDEKVVMEEPAYGRTEGLAANVEREKHFVASIKEIRRFEVPHVAVGDGVSMYENVV